MRPGRLFSATLFSYLLILTACTDSGPAPAVGSAKPDQVASSSVAAAQNHKIPWYDGSVEEAFAAARKTGKPIFLYWGAVWCPPCNQLKATIFKREAFIAQTRLVIPVYLDGDNPRAQEQGDHFGVMGYPTVIMFSPQGEEITRIPGGLNLERYLDVIQLALNEVRPVKTLVADAMAGRTLGDGDWRLLAAYSWGQDNGRIFNEDTNKVDAFRALARHCPAHLDQSCSQLQARAIDSWSQMESRDPQLAREFTQQLDQILSDADLSRANLGFVIYTGKRILPTLVAIESDRGQALQAAWLSRIATLRADNTISPADRMGTWLGELRLATLHSDYVDEELRNAALAAVKTANETTTNPYERSAVINNAWAVLDTAGLKAEADKLLLAELETSDFAYYFMLDLAHNARESGRKDEALQWLQRAWLEAVGPATKLQWGTTYLTGVLEIAPENLQRVKTVSNAIVDDVLKMDGAFHGRNARSLKRIFTALSKWADQENEVALVYSLRKRVTTICEQQHVMGCDDQFNPITVAEII